LQENTRLTPEDFAASKKIDTSKVYDLASKLLDITIERLYMPPSCIPSREIEGIILNALSEYKTRGEWLKKEALCEVDKFYFRLNTD